MLIKQCKCTYLHITFCEGIKEDEIRTCMHTYVGCASETRPYMIFYNMQIYINQTSMFLCYGCQPVKREIIVISLEK